MLTAIVVLLYFFVILFDYAPTRRERREVVVPVSLFVAALSTTLYHSVMELFDFLRFYKYYAIPFQIIIPVIIWVTAEIKMRKKRAA